MTGNDVMMPSCDDMPRSRLPLLFHVPPFNCPRRFILMGSLAAKGQNARSFSPCHAQDMTRSYACLYGRVWCRRRPAQPCPAALWTPLGSFIDSSRHSAPNSPSIVRFKLQCFTPIQYSTSILRSNTKLYAPILKTNAPLQ